MDLRRILLEQLQSLQSAGVSHLPRGAVHEFAEAGAVPPDLESPHLAGARGSTASPPSPCEEPAVPASRRPRLAPTESRAAANTRASQATSLALLAEEVASCKLCGELADTRTQTVFGVGNPQPRLCFFGEAPGADEDRQGEPFVGRAGQLLDKIITACGLTRDEVYILNTLKCRPPNNRTPLPEEVANCRPFFERQLELLRPEFVCCLGAVAARAFFPEMKSLGSLRGKIHSLGPFQVVVTYHPAYLLRNPDMKRATWDDMQMLLRAMGLPIPVKSE